MEQQQAGVVIPQEIIEQSDAIKRQKRTLRQTQVYRDMANLKFIIVGMMASAPRRYAKYFDQMVLTVSNAKQSLAMGLGVKNDPEHRREDLSYALVMIEDLEDDMVILNNLSVIGKKDKKRTRKLAQGIAAQIVRLRDYFGSQGVDMNGKTLLT